MLVDPQWPVLQAEILDKHSFFDVLSTGLVDPVRIPNISCDPWWSYDLPESHHPTLAVTADSSPDNETVTRSKVSSAGDPKVVAERLDSVFHPVDPWVSKKGVVSPIAGSLNGFASLVRFDPSIACVDQDIPFILGDEAWLITHTVTHAETRLPLGGRRSFWRGVSSLATKITSIRLSTASRSHRFARVARRLEEQGS